MTSIDNKRLINKSNEKYWMKKLSISPVSPILDKQVGLKQSETTHQQERFPLPSITANALNKVARKDELNIFLLLKTALQLLIHKYTGHTQVSSSSFSINQNDTENGVEGGRIFFKGMVESDDTLRDFTKSMYYELNGVLQKQHYDYKSFFKKFHSKYPDFARSLNDTLLSYAPVHGVQQEVEGFKLWFHITHIEDNLDLYIKYSESLYTKEFITQLGLHFFRILGQVLSYPDMMIKDITLLNEEEKEELISTFCVSLDNKETTAPLETVIGFFEGHVDCFSERVALIYQEKKLSYLELNQKANIIANYLSSEVALQPEGVIGVAIPKSEWAIIALLGVMKSGAAYLPVDSSLTVNRQDVILKDCNCKTILIAREVSPDIETVPGVNYIDISSGLDSVSDNLSLTIKGNQLAYILYTSGSTGRPKGVMIDHKSLFVKINTITEFLYATEFTSIQLANFAFDVSFFEIFSALLNGGRLVIPEEGSLHDFSYILGLIQKFAVTDINTTPSYFSSLVKTDPSWYSKTKTVQRLYVGGESLDQVLVKEITSKSDIVINNHYGPTETTIDATAYQNVKVFDENIIGKPIGASNIYILDEQGQPVPSGIIGEIHIGGRSLARGYLNNPELTLEKFVVSSFPQDDRLYKTGDYGKWTFDGLIVFKGRQDNQVQLRGLRIELGEISNTLMRHDKVHDAIVLLKKDKEEREFLVAYVVTEHGKEQAEVLRKFLGENLPSYMIPSHFICMERFPLSGNDKRDLKALPDIGDAPTSTRVLPQNLKEKKLLKVFQEILGRFDIGLEADFFELGGDSIKAMQVASRMYKEGYKLEVRNIFIKPVIQELAKETQSIEVHAEQSYVSGTFQLNSLQKEFFNSSYQHHHHFNQSVLLYSEARLNERMLQESLEVIQRHHDALRITFHRTATGYVQKNNLPSNPVPLTTYDLRGESDAEGQLSDNIDQLQKSIDLEQPPLMKVALFRMDEGDRLFILIHHLVVDAVSWLIILEDLYFLYSNHLEGTKINLPPKTSSFKEWVETSYRLAQSQEILTERDFWEKQAEEEISPLLLDGQDSSDTYGDATTVSIKLGRDDTTTLLTNVNSVFSCGIDDLLLTAFALSCRDMFSANRLWIEMEGHGREEGFSLERTVGWFTRIYPTLVEVTDSRDISSQIKKVKEQHLLYKGKSLSYDLLKKLCHDGTPVENNAISTQVSLNYLGQIDVKSSLFRMDHEDINTSMNLSMERDYVFEINGMILNGELVVYITYNALHYQKETIGGLTGAFYRYIEEMVYACLNTKKNFTPSDFSYKFLSQTQVDELSSAYKLENVASLSPMQEGMLYHKLISQGSQAYFEQVGVRVNGKIDESVVRSTLQELTKRHDILRTLFIEVKPTGYLQLVLEESEIEVNVLDFCDFKETSALEAAVSQFKKEDRDRLFELGDEVMMRLTIIQTQKEEFELIWSFHHMLLDGWCSVIFIQEFFLIYEALSSGKHFTLSPVPSYSAFIDWIDAQDSTLTKRYWQDYLEGYEQVAALGSSLLPKSNVYDNQELTFEIGQDEVKALKKMALNHRCTLNILLQAIWGVLLAKLNNSNDVVFGKVVAVRPPEIPEIEHILGLFINTLPVRVRFELGKSFSELLVKLQLESINEEKHQYYSLSELQTTSALKQDLFDHILIFENYPGDYLRGNHLVKDGSLTCTKFATFEQTNYDFNLFVFPGDSLLFKFKFNAERYNKEFVSTLSTKFHSLVKQVLRAPSIPISDLEVLTDSEIEQINSYNNTGLNYPENITYTKLFESSSILNEDAVALKFGDRTLSYKLLNEKSNRLAHYLNRHFDTGPGKIIALLVDRSEQMVIVMMAIVKTGSAYLPIDPSFPVNRIDYILKDSRAAMVIAQKAYTPRIKSEVILTLEDFDCSDTLSINPNCPISPQDPMYLMYTSGSTGRPKGVLITHATAVNFMYAMQAIFDIGRGKNFIALTSYTFDISILELLYPVAFGGYVTIAGQETVNDPLKLIRLIEEERASFVQATPTLWSLLLENGFSGKPDLTILTGGEELRQDLADRLYGCSRIAYNMYGPTETTIWSSYGEIKKGTPVSLGRPIGNTAIYVLDDSKNLLPPGTVGELFIGGEGVASGYLNRPELTQRAFMKDPFSGEGKMYRTGDRGYLKEGNIYYQGRKDYQVKLRGIRIDLGEIERVMESHKGVSQAVVLKQSSERGDYLVGFFMGNIPGGESALKLHLSEYLPAAMVPGHIERLFSFPTTVSGKIDRSAFPTPNRERFGVSKFVLDSTESKMQLLWEEVLGRRGIGVEDNFFDVGGHSLLAIQLLLLVNESFEVDLSLPEFVDAASIRGLVSIIQKRESTGGEIHRGVDIQKGDRGWNRFEPYPLGLIQQAYWVGRSAAFELGVRSMIHLEERHRELDYARFTKSIRKLIGRHDMLRTVILEDGQQQEMNYTPLYSPEYVDLSKESTEGREIELERIRSQMWGREVGSGDWPLFDIAVVSEGEEGYRIVFMIDMIICDASSINQLQQELWTYYTTSDLILEELSFSYRDYILWEEDFRKSDQYQASKSYWQGRLEGFASAPELPVIQEALPSAQGYIYFDHRLDRVSWDIIQRLSAKHQITPTGLLLTLFSDVLGRWSGNNDFVINMTTFNRLPIHQDVNLLIGDFTGVSLLEVDSKASDEFWTRAMLVQKQLWKDIEYRYYSGIEVIRDLAALKGAGAGRMPVVFTSLLGLHEGDKKGEGVGISGGSRTAQVWIDHQVSEHDGELHYTWTVVDGLFPEGMIAEMFDYYGELLSFLTTIGTVDDMPLNTLVHQEFRDYGEQHLLSGIWKHATANPTAEAIVNGNRRITYGQLWGMGRVLSGHLAAAEWVGVVMKKGWEQVVAVVGTLQSGAAYVPIDWSWPGERIKALIEDVGIEQVVTQEEIFEEVVTLLGSGIKVVKVGDELWTKVPQDGRKGDWSEPSDLAYVIFTSGSTGRPKGVMIDHAAAMNTIQDINHRYSINAEDRVLGLSSLSFDLSVYDIFGILSAGGTLVLPEERLNVAEWESLLLSERITLWNTVPSLMELLLDSRKVPTTLLLNLRLVLLSGDWIPVGLPSRIWKAQPDTKVIGLGGATECAIWSVFHEISIKSTTTKSIPYGKGLSNQWLYIYNSDLKECPTWVKGDIYIGGKGLARGYWQDEEKTAAHFIIHPSSGERLYKTGDKGRYLSDGDIEFMGREDNQVKLGGYRIELGEIESTLVAYPKVKDAVAVVCGEGHLRSIGTCFIMENMYVTQSLPSNEHAEVALNKAATAADLPKATKALNGKLSVARLGALLSVYAEQSIDDIPLAKCLYPSAGSLYPVQIYLTIGSGAVEGLADGSYYYCRERHRLLFTGPCPEGVSGITLFHVMYLPAILPVYGSKSSDFGYLESGHMLGLLEGVLEGTGLGLAELDTYDDDQVRTSFQLDDSSVIIGGGTLQTATGAKATEVFSLGKVPDETLWIEGGESSFEEEISSSGGLLAFKMKKLGNRDISEAPTTILAGRESAGGESSYLRRQSIRSFGWEQVPLQALGGLLGYLPVQDEGPMILVQAALGMVEGLSGKVYEYDPVGRRLKVLSIDIPTDLYGDANRELKAMAAFNILLLHRKGSRSRTALISGGWGQLLMEAAPDVGLGLCPLGIDGSHRSLGDFGEVIYSFVGGRVDATQWSEWHPETSSSLAESLIGQLKGYMKSQLPEYMLPVHYELLNTFPLSSNGKVDNKAIKALLESKMQQGKKVILEGRDEVEVKLLRIWRELLGYDGLGVKDNFFEQGCNSLTALKALGVMGHEFGIKLNLENIYEHSTIESLGFVLKAVLWAGQGTDGQDADMEETIL